MSPDRRTRRALLGLGSTALALFAGCLGERSPPAARSTRTGSPETAASPTDAPDVTVMDVQTTPTLVALDSPDSIGTFGGRDEQFVVVSVAVDDAGPPASAFALATDERAVSPTSVDELSVDGRLWNRGATYDGTGAGYLLFRVPNPLVADSAVVRGPGV